MAGFSQLSLQQGLHQSAALAAMTLLITAHRAIMNTGFTLRRRGFCTDVISVFTIGVITCLWTFLVALSSLVLGDKPCLESLEPCAARLAYVPWIMLILFIFWLIAYADEIWYLHRKHTNRMSSDVEAPDTTNTSFRRKARGLKPWKIWQMECSHGHINWSGSVRPTYRYLLYSTMTIVVAFFSYGAARQNLYTIALLNVVGVVLFIVGAGGANKYATAPHIYTADTLRVVLHTDHKEGTVYVLPTKDRGFDAVWSPKIKNENEALDDAIAKFRQAGGRNSPNIPDILPVLAEFHSSTELTKEDINHLAGWLYEPEKCPKMQRIYCNRAPGVHLLARSVMSALWHAEYLVFMRREELSGELRKYIGTLRGQRWTGADIPKETLQVGGRPGLLGYQDAVQYIYRLFDQQVDAIALTPTANPPKQSLVLDPCPQTIEEYVGKLWELCFARQDSTFAGFYAFMEYWDSDIGGGNGWHQFPFRAIDREGDIVSWHIIWRQAWYLAIIAQLTSMSPIIFSAFLAGILQ